MSGPVSESALSDEVSAQDTYFVGVSPQRAAGGLARLVARDGHVLPASRVYPNRADFTKFVHPIVEVLKCDAHVDAVALGLVLGRYGISQELSVGLELQAGGGFNAAALVTSVFRQARWAGQTDAFVARALPADEWTDNARPSLTIRFCEPQRIAALGPLRDRVTQFPGDGWPIDGFTTIPVGSETIGMVQGLRYIFLPEISIRWDMALRARLAEDPEEIDIILLDQAGKIGRMCRELSTMPMVADARLQWFDVIVGGNEDYDITIATLAREITARSAVETSMTRKPFSEILNLCSVGVLRQRLGLFEEVRAVPTKVAGRSPRGA
ncbi:hypothetical protein [Hyphomicrobium sp. MC1]|uniref:hypothetical protein n=1 Tax=Hyphomicrobium sp. (strain MC1) TaxID=717785 RepID=UPI000213EFE7|nr:hypothetical protein [Hyphomicrobium sp. MC1]CCB66692.1 protein of unknown function [Hyphomicrobium sp. MC1]